MRKRALHTFNAKAYAPWLPIAVSLWELSVTAPQVIALRTARMLRAGANPGAHDRRELVRMFAEKAEAIAESTTAMWLQWLAMNQAIALSFFRLRWHPAPRHRDVRRLVSKTIAPIHRRVTANAVRLGRPPRVRRGARSRGGTR